ncbi:NAD-dependent succinate-semialdehyde dehydrogenase [Variovorax ginsengisoli]|uniref:Succinate-semialdehyde dehydrogenase/glutarate-semialdehyde dehydrogenase n=1 Tax=Variovorax ginsengisoli TaxID=363844 RepID=A0ABT9S9T1_9BURK|nr:NAD-dependent succinate-semialdehyde dehydrogenase [Variovorax ginsengisoli]MDP9901116.1 succinate-semialdehyde dehydrogenase/glutarate-semialdehyde dehydrogenase [Variovorax ginsengisoli]
MTRDLLKDPGLFRAAAQVGGEWIASTPHGCYTLRNPADDSALVELPRFKEAETDAAIEVAHAAFLSWRKVTAKERSEVLRRWYEMVLAHRDDLATLITLEEGKPLAEAKVEVDYAASFLQWFSEEAKRVRGDVIPAPKDGQRIVVLKEPIGVCAAITPWNFPAAMITRKAGPALAAGCSMVVKPASQTPLTALALAELALRAGVPPGVFNVVTGNDTRAIGNRLTGHPLVRKLTFTGSTEVGRLLLAQASATIKKCSMELGGNAPFIVFDDADLDAAADGVVAAKFRNTGQACISANRILVQSGVHDAFAAKLVERVARLRVGNGLEPDVQLGPLIDDAAVAKVEEHIANAVVAGARVLHGGGRHVLGGRFFEPTVLAGATSGMALAREETFGPLAPLFRFEREEDAIALANATEFGLAAYLYSRDAARIWRVAAALETGMLGINSGLISNEVAPFGGVKQSGLGREGSHHGIDEFLEIKYLCWGGLSDT